MALQYLALDAMAAVYVGQAGQTSPLSLISSQRTQGGHMTYSIPEKFEEVAGNSVQTGRQRLDLTLTFLSDDDYIVGMACGNLPGVINTPSEFAQLALLLVHPDGSTGDHDIYIPQCYVLKTFDINWEKTRPTIIPLKFHFESRNTFNLLFYKASDAGMAAIMTSQYPL